jgi:phospholipid-binding lipoprotein MlaA
MLPLLGPSNPRDATGRAVDAGARAYTWFIPFWASFALSSVNAADIVNSRAAALETIREERAQAFDWYAAVRSAYTQYRENKVHDRAEAPDEATTDEDLYDVEE